MKHNEARVENILTQEELKKLVHYEPDTGSFTWKVRSAYKVKVGDMAGGVDPHSGYRVIRINGKNYPAHRLAFLYITGSFPKQQVDHINRVRDDNRWVNLREVSPKENQMNRSIGKNNNSEVMGVSWCRTTHKWIASITVNGKLKHLGYFSKNDLDKATEVRRTAELKYGFHENHGK